MKTDGYLREILDTAAEDGYILDTVIASPIEKATFVSQLAKELFMTDWSLDCVDVIERAQAAVTSASTLWYELTKEFAK